MKKARFTEMQIIGILKEADARTPVKEICRTHGIAEGMFILLKPIYTESVGGSMFKHLGRNATIFPLAKIIHPENISIGDESIIADFSFLYAVGKGIEIGNFCHVTEHAILQAGGLLQMGDFSAIGPRTTILAATDDYEGNGFIGLKVFGDKYRKLVFKDVIIGRHAHIGMGSMIMPGVHIGEGCTIGAGSLVTKDMPKWTICYGSPCRPRRDKPREKQLTLEKEFLEEYYGRSGV